jgi:hypothetical protein
LLHGQATNSEMNVTKQNARTGNISCHVNKRWDRRIFLNGTAVQLILLAVKKCTVRQKYLASDNQLIDLYRGISIEWRETSSHFVHENSH